MCLGVDYFCVRAIRKPLVFFFFRCYTFVLINVPCIVIKVRYLGISGHGATLIRGEGDENNIYNNCMG